MRRVLRFAAVAASAVLLTTPELAIASAVVGPAHRAIAMARAEHPFMARVRQGEVPAPAPPVRPGRPGAVRPGAPPPGRQPLPSPEGRSVAEVEQLFDNYVLGQARPALRLTPDQMRTFAQRFRQLQMVRRRSARQHQNLLQELNELTRPGASTDDATLTAKLAALDQQVASAEQQVRDAYQQVEQLLTVAQRARLRPFEQRMERQKLQLVAQARELAAGRVQRPGGPGTADLPAADVPPRR